MALRIDHNKNLLLYKEGGFFVTVKIADFV